MRVINEKENKGYDPSFQPTPLATIFPLCFSPFAISEHHNRLLLVIVLAEPIEILLIVGVSYKKAESESGLFYKLSKLDLIIYRRHHRRIMLHPQNLWEFPTVTTGLFREPEAA